jgi:rhodanese-related sulfurtransferase
MSAVLNAESLYATLGLAGRVVLVDVRSARDFAAQPRLIPGALRRDAHAVGVWAHSLPHAPLVAVCDRGGNESGREIAAALAELGYAAMVLEGGIDAWIAAGRATVKIRAELTAPSGSRWITRERPKIDRLACPWLIRRFIDPRAVFHFVPADWVEDVADELGAIPFDIEGVHHSHRGETCSFDTLIAEFAITDPPLSHLARIVRGADTARLDLEPQSAGLLAISLGLSAIETDDLRQLEAGMPIYDALYGWCRHATGERHNWPAKAVAT